MANLLVIEASFRAENSSSRRLTKKFMANWQEKYPQAKIKTHDLRLNPIPHLDEHLFGSWLKEPSTLTAKQQNALNLANQIISDVKQADILVFGAPLYNFNLSSNLKAWLDHLQRSGETFKYTENGPIGLLNNKKAVVLSACGGIYAEGVGDFQTPYLRHSLAFNGITDVTFIKAEGLDMGEDMRSKGLNFAYSQIKQLVSALEASI